MKTDKPTLFSNSFRSIVSASVLATLLFPIALQSASGQNQKTSFEYKGGHLLCIPVKLNNSLATTFILDTGVGVNLLSDSLAKKLACKKMLLLHSGKRMSGQTLTMNMARLGSLTFAGFSQTNVPVALWKTQDLFGNSKDFADVQGILSLDFFKKQAFTIDYKSKSIILENEESLKSRLAKGISVPIKVESKAGIECSIKIPMSMEKFPKLMAEVDTGSDSLILDLRYMKGLNIRTADVKRVVGKDETGHAYMRYFTKLPGNISVKGAASIKQTTPSVMFQKIIHDGLIGDSFLKQFTITYDISHSRMIFEKPQ